jgi:hypothetical protein
MPGDFAFEYDTDRPVDIVIRDEKVWVTLADGRIIANPLAWHPWLANATVQQREHVELTPFSVYWPDLDEGLDVEGMLRGIRPRPASSAEEASTA